MSASQSERGASRGDSSASEPTLLHVLTLSGQWDGGGPLAVNCELSIALSELGCRVTARVGNPCPAHPTVEIQCLDTIPGIGDSRAQLLRADGLPGAVDVIIGHGRFSGGVASYLRDHFYPQAHVVHFVHVTADEMDRLRGDPLQSNQHTATERALVQRADLVVGVGPLLTEEAARLARMCEPPPAVAEMTPGVVLASPPRYTDHQRRPNLLVFCRTDDPLKGADIAAAAVGELQARGVALRLTLLGSMSDDVVAQERHLSDIANLPVRVRPYTFDHSAIEAEIRGADLVIHPAVHEDFGLAPLEAAGYGVPILVGGHTGVGMFLDDPRRVPAEFGRPSVVHLPAGRDRNVSGVWAARIETVLRDLPLARERALGLRNYLGDHCTWQRAAGELIEAIRALPQRSSSAASDLSLTEPASHQRQDGPAEAAAGRRAMDAAYPVAAKGSKTVSGATGTSLPPEPPHTSKPRQRR